MHRSLCPPARRRPAAVAAAFVALVLSTAAVGCSSSSSTSSRATTSSTATTAAERAPRAAPRQRDEVPDLTGAKGAFGDLRVSDCSVEPGRVQASGTLRNATSATVDFVLLVRWVATKGNGVLDRDVVVLERVAPSKTVTWRASGTVPAKAHAECTYSVRRGALSR